MDKTSQNHPRNYSKAKKSTRSKRSSTTEKGDEATNTMSNGGDIQSPMHHGNRNILFPMTATPSHDTNNDTIFKITSQNNVDPEICKNLQPVDEAWLFIDDINQTFEIDENPTNVFT
jgi:hypothetical protein